MRYKSTERLGVNATEGIILREFDWIFREQPIVDVGIDALIEESEDGNPTGKFIALQIKSGKGNFSLSRDKLTYYISNIHHNYWLNFDIPMLLIAHIPETNLTYWIEISQRTIKKTKKRWKVDIPIRNKLNIKAKEKIAELLTDKNYEYQSIKIFKGEDIDSQTVYDIAEKSTCLEDCKDSTIKTIELLESFTLKSNESSEKFKYFNEIGLTFKSPRVIASVGTYAKNMNLASKRMENECQIFSETFGAGIFAFEQAIMVHFFITQDIENVQKNLKSVETLPSALDSAIKGVNFMQESISKLPEDYKTLIIAKKQMMSVVDLIIDEYKVAKIIVGNLIESSNKLIEKSANKISYKKP
ncbi:DUF4365 domain-containing protein [Aggregatimonas sangjinii]|uniref:DUF4365 domain-containing protein n=1 Tax=Aggregatimonas sangjinii TaxID=2583587 RepID=A0A5B7SKQ7_9FLAO|nr:DUF4365 domain-containing protein [Aggregatimonas sangjinii]QCW98621.1 DUF4365 domain-containing protein [Aggregatimonas sangjinii]